MIYVFPKWVERFGAGAVIEFATSHNLWVVQSGDRARWMLVPRFRTDSFPFGGAA